MNARPKKEDKTRVLLGPLNGRKIQLVQLTPNSDKGYWEENFVSIVLPDWIDLVAFQEFKDCHVKRLS